MILDPISLQRINTAHPREIPRMLKCYTAMCLALSGRATVRITCVFRSDAEQQSDYNKGRFGNPGPIITNALPGQSKHWYGIAFDFCLYIDTNGDGKYDTASWDMKTDFDGDGQSDWKEAIAVAKENGYDWGGDWKTFKDNPHLERRGYDIKDLVRARNAKRYIPGTQWLEMIG